LPKEQLTEDLLLPPDSQWLEWVPTTEEIKDCKLSVQPARPDEFLGYHVMLLEELGKSRGRPTRL